MATYYVNTQQDKDGDHEVHEESCHKMPKTAKELGDFFDCKPAVARAKALGFHTANGCKICSPDCHTS